MWSIVQRIAGRFVPKWRHYEFRDFFDLAIRYLKYWWFAFRAPSLAIAFVSCLAGVVLAFSDGHQNWLYGGLVILAGLFLQSGVNLVNDFFEYKQHNIDDKMPELGLAGIEREIIEWINFLTGMAFFGLAGLIGLFFVIIRGDVALLCLGIVGFIGGFFYTGEPLNYKRRGLAVLLVFFLMGVMMIAGSYLAVTGSVSMRIIWVSIPISLLVSHILLINELRDYESDVHHGIRTLTVRIGFKAGVRLYYALAAGAYLTTVVLALFGLIPLVSIILTFVALVFLVKPTSKLNARPEERRPAVPLIMLHHLAFGLLFLVAYTRVIV
ncbi:MAG TPA: prenyltransferase [Spirochaetia bacterium]|nr:prenyltransferase [Spirochaetia bacterium]